MTLIKFTIKSINSHCTTDIELFLKGLGHKVLPLFNINKEIVFDLQEDYDTVLNQIELILKDMKLNGTYLETFKNQESQQEKLWILRTLLLYNILIIATLCMTTKDTFENVKRLTPDESMFPESVQDLYKLFELGNFGSYNKTSDIDLGIQFIGNYKRDSDPKMANVIWLIEGLFIVLTTYDTLQYDIELYGDMLTIKVDEKETFYLDTSKITDITSLLPCAMYSVARNQLIDTIKPENEDVKPENEEYVKSIFNTDKTDEIILNHLNKPVLSDKEQKVLKFLKTNVNVGHFIQDIDITILTKAYNSAKTQMVSYLKSSYENGKYIQTSASRKMYYDALVLAETERIKFLNTSENGEDINALISLINAIANSLSYRMEDYTCVSTVTHVVRTIQSGEDITSEPDKRNQTLIECKNKTSNFSDKPFCMLGKNGLILSIIEQIGFMNRFYNHYCKEPLDTHCFSKLFKYEFRVVHAMELIPFLDSSQVKEVEPDSPELDSPKVKEVVLSGGFKKNKTLKKTKKSKKTKKIKNKFKYTFDNYDLS